MISENIKELRTKKGLTQKELADKLHVTAQAVSRWENGDVEPSVDTISTMAQIFEVTTDEIIGGPDKKPKPEVVTEKEYVVEQARPVLAVCEQCNKPIFDGKEIVRQYHTYNRTTHTKIICKKCDEKNKKEAYERACYQGLEYRRKSFLWGTILTVLIAVAALIATSAAGLGSGAVIGITAVALLFFPFFGCLFLHNNFVFDMCAEINGWGFVRLPGLIFELSLDGIVWLLTVKLAFWILGIMLAIAAFLLSVVIGLIVSLFVYPFALKKNIDHPEMNEEY